MYSKILVPIDGSPTASEGLAEAIRLARLSGGTLRLLHVIDMLSFSMIPDNTYGMTAELFDALKEGGEAVLAKARAQCEAAGIACETKLAEGYASRLCDVVVDDARASGAEVIVLGTHGRRGVGRVLLGSDAEMIVRQAPVPVLLVRGGAAPKV
ncbi:MAG: universal stress protein [Burkholderiales bacterium]|nr:universal stress protein [Burkholderiales bacterium]MDE2452092.1 universal stress protein [Burkholderiales bacterium]